MRYAAIICAVLSFFLVLWITPWVIKYMKKIGLLVQDKNKRDKPLVPISGGLAVMAGIFLGLLSYVFIRTFFFQDGTLMLYVFAALTSILIITFVGFVDDLLIDKDKSSSAGLSQWQKPLLTATAAVPLMVVNAGTTTMSIPLIGVVNLGIIYPLILIPIGVVGASNMVNMLAGMNGLETGLGLVYIGMLGLYAYVNGSVIASILALVTFSSLLAFYLFNKCPAKILPGDSLTYLLGAVLASVAVLGNIEKAALIVSIPFFAEFFLKLRSRFKAQSYGECDDGKIKTNYKKVYSLTHLFTRTGKFTEKQIVMYLILIELFFSSLIWIV